MAIFYLVLVLISIFIVMYSTIWSLFTKDSLTKVRPFIQVEWIALLVLAGLSIASVHTNGWYVLLAIYWLISSFVRHRQFVRYLDAKDALESE